MKNLLIGLFLITVFFGITNNVFTQEQEKKSMSLRLKSNGPGEITPTPAYYLFETNKNVILTASTTENKYRFLYWKQNDTIISTSNILIYNIPSYNSTVSAYFTEENPIIFKYNGLYVYDEITIPLFYYDYEKKESEYKRNITVDVILNNKEFPNYVLFSYVNGDVIESIKSEIHSENTASVDIKFIKPGVSKLIVTFSRDGVIYTNQLKINVYK